MSLNPLGATKEVIVSEETTNRITHLTKNEVPDPYQIVSGQQTQVKTDKSMEDITIDFSKVFEKKTGKFKGDPIKIQIRPNAIPVIQPTRRIPLHYIDPLNAEIERMIRDDIIEGPLEIEEPGTYISNLVITDKKWDPSGNHIRVTLDCQAAIKIYTKHMSQCPQAKSYVINSKEVTDFHY